MKIWAVAGLVTLITLTQVWTAAAWIPGPTKEEIVERCETFLRTCFFL